MVPVIANQGCSFAGAFAYYFHDRNASTVKRIAWKETLNLFTDSVEKAWKRMAYTAKHQSVLKRASGQRQTGARLKKPVFCYSLSWHPEQNPSREMMRQAAQETLSILGLQEHQAVIVAHNDTAHPHVHVIVNTVHPLTGLVAKLKHTKRKLSAFALNHERKEGKMYCPNREENQARREAGNSTRHCDPVIADAWEQSRDGPQFIEALKSNGYCLAQGRRLVVVDYRGNIYNPARELGLKVKEFKAGLQGIDLKQLPSLEEARAKCQDPMISNQPDTEALNREMAALQLRQLDELQMFERSYESRIDLKRMDLEAFHQLSESRLRIADLERKVSGATWLQRILGIKAIRERRLSSELKSMEEAQERFDEAINGFERKKRAAIERLNQRHGDERKSLEASFDLSFQISGIAHQRGIQSKPDTSPMEFRPLQ